jgi:hypothetical protein
MLINPVPIKALQNMRAENLFKGRIAEVLMITIDRRRVVAKCGETSAKRLRIERLDTYITPDPHDIMAAF